MKRVLIYSKFERFWHWCQALLVLLLALTGFEIHYQWGLMSFPAAVFWHKILAWAFVILITFAIFWHLTTGQWKQYVPGRGNIIAQVLYYMFGIFKKAPHPQKRTPTTKLNPLQQIAYVVLKILVIPIMVTTGFLYYYYNDWRVIGLENWSLQPVALIHTGAEHTPLVFTDAGESWEFYE